VKLLRIGAFDMAVYNQPADASNTAVRAFLTKLGEFYLESSFNTASGPGKKHWDRIKEQVFDNRCAYCDVKENSLTIEHLIMFNKDQCGLHHPGNIVPCCKPCNKRSKTNKVYNDWETFLLEINERSGKSLGEYQKRRTRILNHIKNENYPVLTSDEINAIKALTNSLYESIKLEFEKSLQLFKKLDETLIQGRKASTS
jgi:hypothetical protein